MNPSQDPLPGAQPDAEEPEFLVQILERLRTHGAAHSRYQSRGEVARGGMGAILRVWDEDLRRELAMKVVLGPDGRGGSGIPPKTMGRFLEEAQVTGQLDHPGIVPVHELGVNRDGAAFFTMRLVKGHDLKEVFARVHAGDEEWTLTRALWVMLKVCDAMAYAHSKGVIHRDLKPANVMVGRFGEVYVMDWGLSRVLGSPDRHDLRLRHEEQTQSLVESERRADTAHSADSLLFTMDGDVVGTPAYMAPEQARGEIERLGPASDVYAVGAMLYHLLTAQMPYVAPGAKVSQHMVLRWVLEGPPKPLGEVATDLPQELVAICEKAMHREPDQRYADMGELAQDLRAYLENRVVRAYSTGAWVELKKWVQRNRKLAVAWASAAALAGIGLAATTFVQVRGRRVAEAARTQAVRAEQKANANLAEAQRQEEIARSERANVLRLSAFRELEDLERAADRLWPATPELIGEMEAWMKRAERLIAGLDPGPDGDTGHRAQLAELRSRQRPLAPDERAELLKKYSRRADLEALERRIEASRLAQEVRAGRAAPPVVELDPADFPEDPFALNEAAFALVDPARSSFGREAEGLALARAAVDAVDDEQWPLVLDTLAWACFAVGLDDEALQHGREAAATSALGTRAALEDSLTNLAHAVALARGASDEASRGAREELSLLENEALGSRFDTQDDRWWYEKLEELVRAIEAFADPRTGLVTGTSSQHGWGMARRLAFARALEERTLGPRMHEAWKRARADVRATELYAGLDLPPQRGLVPLGADPDSGLQEFADVATGEPARRGANGRLQIGPESSVVFVLVPGGVALLGAQSADPLGEHFDPDAQPGEYPVHRVRLDPFLLAKHEMTQGQWLRFTGDQPSKRLAGTQVQGRLLDGRVPVEQVSWLEATRQMERLGWKLPTEAQWEYAARTGTGSAWWTGEDPDSLQGAGNLYDRFASEHGAEWPGTPESFDDGFLVQAPVGSFDANPFGLHDVIGNVYEWCSDLAAPYGLDALDGAGERPGGNPATRIVRGGSYVSTSRGARSAKRDLAQPELQNESIGLRPARAIER
jgi:formylglycine-generating enzyme required for sulfatase activity/serine/threonine protein kinase